MTSIKHEALQCAKYGANAVDTTVNSIMSMRSATDKVLGTLGMVENSAGRGMKKINRQIT